MREFGIDSFWQRGLLLVCALIILLLIGNDELITRRTASSSSSSSSSSLHNKDSFSITNGLFDAAESGRMLQRALHFALTGVALAEGNGMGHTGDDDEQTAKIFDSVLTYGIKAGTVCEIGFNVGHSASTILSASFSGAFIGFDYGRPHVTPGSDSVSLGFNVLKRTLRHVSFELVIGDSMVTAPKYALEHPTTVCEIFHIDGSHDGPFPEADFQSARKMARSDGRTLVLFDDCGCQTEWCVKPAETFERAVKEGTITLLPNGASYLPAGGRRTCAGYMKRAP